MSEEDVCLYCKKQKCVEDCQSLQKSIQRLILPLEKNENVESKTIGKTPVTLFLDYQGWSIMQCVYK